jgi:hypothetical protein
VDARVVVIEQPNYLPWIGYFDLVAQADLWVWYDDVQYTRRDWRNRNRIAGEGEPLWLTVPVKTRGRFEQRICDVEVDRERPWVRKHLGALRHCYGGAPYFAPVYDLLEGVLAQGHRFLTDLTIASNEALCGYLGLRTRFLRSSALAGVEGRKQDRLLAICRRLGATVYLSGPAARAYIVPQAFREAGVELRYIVYDYPPYDRGGRRFIPRLSIVDPLVWLGPRQTAALLARHARWESAGDAQPCQEAEAVHVD